MNKPPSSPGLAAETLPPAGFESLLSRYPLLFSFLATALTLTATLLLFSPLFVVNDDNIKLMFAKGVGPCLQPTEFIGHSNILLGFLFKTLYTYFPAVPWYPLNISGSIFVGIWAIFYSVLISPHRLYRFLLLFFGTQLVHIFFLTWLQFTVAASVAAEGGILLLASLWRNNDAVCLRRRLVGAGLLLFHASLIRASALGLLCFTALPLVVFLLWGQSLTPSRKTLLGYSTAIFLFIVAAFAFNYCYTSLDPGWAKFNAFDAQRVDLQDYRHPVYTFETKPLFDSIGWTENDLDLIYYWYYMDEDIYSTEKLAKVNSHFPEFHTQKRREAFMNDAAMWRMLFFLGVLLFFIPMRAFRMIAASIAVVLLMFLYFYFFMRIPQRVFLPQYCFLFYLAVFFAVPKAPFFIKSPDSASVARKSAAFLIVLFLLCSAWILNKNYRFYQDNLDRRSKALYAALNTFSPQDNQLYVIWDSTFPFESIRAYDDYEFARHFHMIILAVFQRSPHTYAMMEHFGIRNLAKDIVDNPNVFIFCRMDFMQLYITHMKEKYGMDVGFQLVQKLSADPFLATYQIKTRKPDEHKAGNKAGADDGETGLGK